jgi:hypothetical protein
MQSPSIHSLVDGYSASIVIIVGNYPHALRRSMQKDCLSAEKKHEQRLKKYMHFTDISSLLQKILSFTDLWLRTLKLIEVFKLVSALSTVTVVEPEKQEDSSKNTSEDV